ncbi:MAG: hypothetical protein U0573_06870 [Phycisphaerales bacterium]|nr:hypothetical protein [Planctomycetota bacterium]
MTPSLHVNLLSAFLAGKSCSAIALAFNLSIEDILAWFESERTQSTLRRLEALQLHQARIVSSSLLPAATGSLSNTSTAAPDLALRTRAAANLVRLGLRFCAPPSKARAPIPGPEVLAALSLSRESQKQAPRETPPASHPESPLESRAHSPRTGEMPPKPTDPVRGADRQASSPPRQNSAFARPAMAITHEAPAATLRHSSGTTCPIQHTLNTHRPCSLANTG